jgi:hypothetical protein
LLREQVGHQHGGGGAQGSVPESDAPYGYVGAVKAEPPKPAAAQAPQNKMKQKRLRAAANRAERGEPPKHGGAWSFVTDPICNFEILNTNKFILNQIKRKLMKYELDRLISSD